MDVKQAREIIKNNYPPENYTMLRETLDWLLEQAEKVERLELVNLVATHLMTDKQLEKLRQLTNK